MLGCWKVFCTLNSRFDLFELDTVMVSRLVPPPRHRKLKISQNCWVVPWGSGAVSSGHILPIWGGWN